MTLTNFHGTKFGAFCPGFWYSGVSMFMNPNHGQLLINNLTKTVGAGALCTLGEGFSDEEEGCALWRSDDAVYYDYPNQRPNILRRFSRKAWADKFKVEAEACDSFSGLTAGTGMYRNGSINIIKCNDTNVGWGVTKTQANAWLQWRELPLPAKTRFTLRYSSAAASSIQFSVGGSALPAVNLPSTNGAWTTAEAGTFSADTNGYHTVRITVVSGSPDLNYFNIINSSVGTVVPVKKMNEGYAPAWSGRVMSGGRVAEIPIRLGKGGHYGLELYSPAGRMILSKELSGKAGIQNVAVNSLAPGVWCYRVVEK